jgi:hypothetical protein
MAEEGDSGSSSFNAIIIGLIVGIAIGLLIGYFVFSGKQVPSALSPNTTSASNTSSSTTPVNETRNNIPDETFTCEELIPDSLKLIFVNGENNSHPYIEENINRLKVTSRIINKKYCERQTETSQNINLFSCSYEYSISGRKTDVGTVAESYKVKFVFNLDNRNCTFSSSTNFGSLMDCRLVSSSCYWEYYT